MPCTFGREVTTRRGDGVTSFSGSHSRRATTQPPVEGRKRGENEGDRRRRGEVSPRPRRGKKPSSAPTVATLEGRRKKYGRGQFIRRLSPAAPAHQYIDIQLAHVYECARSPPRYIRLPPGERVCVDRAHYRRSVGEKYIGASLFLVQVRLSALSPRPL